MRLLVNIPDSYSMSDAVRLTYEAVKALVVSTAWMLKETIKTGEMPDAPR